MTDTKPDFDAAWEGKRDAPDEDDTPTCYWRPGRSHTLCGQPYGEAFQLSWNHDEVDCAKCRDTLREKGMLND
jgi:hypothetical protein